MTVTDILNEFNSKYVEERKRVVFKIDDMKAGTNYKDTAIYKWLKAQNNLPSSKLRYVQAWLNDIGYNPQFHILEDGVRQLALDVVKSYK